jgi:hypothetical protein
MVVGAGGVCLNQQMATELAEFDGDTSMNGRAEGYHPRVTLEDGKNAEINGRISAGAPAYEVLHLGLGLNRGERRTGGVVVRSVMEQFQ